MDKVKHFYEKLPATLSDEDRMAGAKFLAETTNEDTLAVIVRAHLYLESTLTLLIEEYLAEPGALEVDRLAFSIKVGLALALGALPESLKQPLQMVNSLRNRFAHNIYAQLDASDADKLFKSFSKYDRGSIHDNELSYCLSYLYGALYALLKQTRSAKSQEPKES
jgi:hypothetical protein